MAFNWGHVNPNGLAAMDDSYAHCDQDRHNESFVAVNWLTNYHYFQQFILSLGKKF